MTNFKTIVADPPWNETGGGKIKRGADRHYPLLKTHEIIEVMLRCPLWSPEPRGSHLYLWVTNNFVPDGLEVMKALGFTYKTNIAWVKDRIGLGQYFRGQHELALFGVRGRWPVKEALPTVLKAKRRAHSQKPDEFYVNVMRSSPGPFLEMFAREKREGWSVWGNEVEGPTDEDEFKWKAGWLWTEEEW